MWQLGKICNMGQCCNATIQKQTIKKNNYEKQQETTTIHRQGHIQREMVEGAYFPLTLGSGVIIQLKNKV